MEWLILRVLERYSIFNNSKKKERDRQIDRQTDRQTDELTDMVSAVRIQSDFPCRIKTVDSETSGNIFFTSFQGRDVRA